MSASSWDLARSLSEATSNNFTVLAGQVPPGTRLPYAVLGDTAELDWHRFGQPGGEVRLTIHILGSDRAEAEESYEILHGDWQDKALTLSEHRLLRGTLERVSSLAAATEDSPAYMIIVRYTGQTESI